MQSIQNDPFYFDIRQKNAQWQFNERLFQLISGAEKAFNDITVVCIGSDRLIGDSYGPLTGHMLSGAGLNISLFGTLERPVHALSIGEVIEKINPVKSLVIAIDSSVGSDENIGVISAAYEPVRPGSGLGKKLPEIGDISVTGITASCVSPFLSLQNAPLGLIYKMAEKTYIALKYAVLKSGSYGSRSNDKFENTDVARA